MDNWHDDRYRFDGGDVSLNNNYFCSFLFDDYYKMCFKYVMRSADGFHSYDFLCLNITIQDKKITKKLSSHLSSCTILTILSY